MKHHTKLSREQQQTEEQHSLHQAGREFATPEELLRYDAAQTAVPSEIALKLQKSLDQAQPSRRSWWKSLLGG